MMGLSRYAWSLVVAQCGAIVVGVAGCAASDEMSALSGTKKPVSACSTDRQCGSDAVCVSSMCMASHGEVRHMVVEATPPITFAFGGGMPFLAGLADLSDLIGWDSRNISLPNTASLQGKLLIGESVFGGVLARSEECDANLASDLSMRVEVRASRARPPVGLPSYSITPTQAKQSPKKDGWVFDISVPSDTYDIYIVPTNGCQFPPVFFPAQKLEEGALAEPYTFRVDSLKTVSGDLQLPATEKLGKWTVQLVEPLGGRVISNTVQLPESTAESTTNFLLYYRQLDGLVPLVRLSAASTETSTETGDLAQLSVLWDLSAVDLDNDGKISLDVRKLAQGEGSVVPVSVPPQLVDELTEESISDATIVARSKNLVSGLVATFDAKLVLSAGKKGDLKLLPGDYQVVVSPNSANFAVTQATWTVSKQDPSQPQYGRTVEVKRAIQLSGTVLDPQKGSPVTKTRFELAAMPVSSQGFLGNAVGPVLVSPRLVSGETSTQGQFSKGVDPGRFIFAAQTSETSGFPWVVRAGLQIEFGQESSIALGPVEGSFPVVADGTLTDPAGNRIPRALLRAFALVQSDGTGATKPELAQAAVQVAETWSDQTGHFRILIPSRLRH